MKQFNGNLDKVAHELPLDLVKYMKTCTCKKEVTEVLEIALDNEYVQALDWLYSVIDEEPTPPVIQSSSRQFISELLKIDPSRVEEHAFYDALYEASELVENTVFYDKQIMIRRKDQVYFVEHQGQVGAYYIKNVGE